MEASIVVLRQIPCFSSSRYYVPCFSQVSKPSPVITTVRRPRCRILISGFYDKGHLQYYHDNNNHNSNFDSSSTSMIRSEKITKEKGPMKMKKKKQMKLLKGLSRDLSTISQMDFGLVYVSDQSLLDQSKVNIISEAAELLLVQLQKLKAEKELKRKRKEEKTRLKAAAQMQNRNIGCEMSSSSSSESSDSECGEVVDMNDLKRSQAEQDALKPVIEDPITLPPIPSRPTMPVLVSGISEEKLKVWRDTKHDLENECCCSGTGGCSCRSLGNLGGDGNINSLVTATCSKKFEVCMGGKCKKFGAAAILEEFQRVVGIEGAVSGCKCMGKCSDGPNVRVVSGYDADNNCVRTPSIPLCIGVGLEDVDMIVANFLGENRKQLPLAAAP